MPGCRFCAVCSLPEQPARRTLSPIKAPPSTSPPSLSFFPLHLRTASQPLPFLTAHLAHRAFKPVRYQNQGKLQLLQSSPSPLPSDVSHLAQRTSGPCSGSSLRRVLPEPCPCSRLSGSCCVLAASFAPSTCPHLARSCSRTLQRVACRCFKANSSLQAREPVKVSPLHHSQQALPRTYQTHTGILQQRLETNPLQVRSGMCLYFSVPPHLL